MYSGNSGDTSFAPHLVTCVILAEINTLTASGVNGIGATLYLDILPAQSNHWCLTDGFNFVWLSGREDMETLLAYYGYGKPIERVAVGAAGDFDKMTEAELVAYIMSKAPRVWGKDTPADTVPRTRDAERPLPDARRAEHGAENGRRARGEPPGAVEARSLFAGEDTPDRPIAQDVVR